jgi:hypothetical protein
MISEYFQIKSSIEEIEHNSRKVCYLCLPKSQWITNNQKDLIENKLEEIENE